jgi:hypothetical protein
MPFFAEHSGERGLKGAISKLARRASIFGENRPVSSEAEMHIEPRKSISFATLRGQPIIRSGCRYSPQALSFLHRS